jgi:hypothetical protein
LNRLFSSPKSTYRDCEIDLLPKGMQQVCSPADSLCSSLADLTTEGLNVTVGDSHRRRTRNVSRKTFQPDEIDDEDTPSLAASDVTMESYSFGDDSSRELSADFIPIEQAKVMRASRTEKQRPQPDSLRTRKVCADIETRTKKYIYPSMLQNVEFKEAIKIVVSNICAEIGDNTDIFLFSTANAHKKTVLNTFI